MVAVAIFDAAVLGWESVLVQRELARTTVAPTFAVTSGAGIAGLGGSF
jgi:hypothetical protein